MELTLSLDDFRRIVRMPSSVMLGFACQFTIKPLCGWRVATRLGLETGPAVGIILVASCPGGMASNMITYLALQNGGMAAALARQHFPTLPLAAAEAVIMEEMGG